MRMTHTLRLPHHVNPVALLLGLGLFASAAEAQVLRGTVTEEGTGAPLSGVLVTLERLPAAPGASPAAVVNVLSSRAGEYSLRAPVSGRFQLSLKRIGVQRFTTLPFDIAAGETKQVDVTLAPAVAHTLPRVLVTTADPCERRGNQPTRVAALWDEARTALTATQVSLRERLFDAWVTRYVRHLDPQNLRILAETRAGTQGLTDRPFVSLSGEVLAERGFWHQIDRDTLAFYAPDADVLLSDAFLATHCFTATGPTGGPRPAVGLTFQPRRGRGVPDVSGTLWLDARTFELRLVEFTYTRLPVVVGGPRLGGEVHFARLPSGAWVVRRWFVRMPHYAQITTPARFREGRDRGPRTAMLHRVIEEGGDVFADGLRLFDRPAAVFGTVLDSLGRPLPGSHVRLSGTPFLATSDTAGRFRFDSLPAGRHTVVAEHEAYAELGLLVDDLALAVEEGETRRVVLRAERTADIAARMCPSRPPATGIHGIVRLTMLDTTSGAPMRELPLWLRWRVPVDSQIALDSTIRRVRDAATGEVQTFVTRRMRTHDGVESMTDAQGVVVFCGMPADRPLELHRLLPDGGSAPLHQFRLQAGGITPLTLTIPPPR
ncbi:MAG TPA: carboxypeptidase-like regulatory domain-containing protein [Gemmatimonadaceae bacterium]|nr:carboxypeptidase-like regulatory domain-containing protein [Gemmatimonadaceae bacterium]